MQDSAIDEMVNILLVEDNPGDIRLTREALRRGRIQGRLDVVEDGIQALAYLRRQGDYGNALRPDVILLDLNLPMKDGRQVLAEIKADPDLAEIPVVVLTMSGIGADIDQTLDLQAKAYITKPVDAEQLTSVLAMLRRSPKGSPELPEAEEGDANASDAPAAG